VLRRGPTFAETVEPASDAGSACAELDGKLPAQARLEHKKKVLARMAVI
jgi:citrate lyase beta subunit